MTSAVVIIVAVLLGLIAWPTLDRWAWRWVRCRRSRRQRRRDRSK